MKKKISKTKKDSITKADLKSVLKEQTADFKRYVGAVSEDFQHKTVAIAEQYLDIKRTLDSHTKTLDSHTEMIGKLMIDMTVVKEDIRIIKNDLKQKVGLEDFMALERRVAMLEKQNR